VKDNQRGKTSFVVDLEKKHAAEDLLMSLTTHHRQLLTQMKQMVEIYIRLAELETTKEDTNKKIAVPRDVRSIRQLELVCLLHIPPMLINLCLVGLSCG
jgi:ataxia telangiectasia mutated family protein